MRVLLQTCLLSCDQRAARGAFIVLRWKRRRESRTRLVVLAPRSCGHRALVLPVCKVVFAQLFLLFLLALAGIVLLLSTRSTSAILSSRNPVVESTAGCLSWLGLWSITIGIPSHFWHGTFSPAQWDMCRLLVEPIPGSLHPSGLCQRGSNMVDDLLSARAAILETVLSWDRDMLFRSIIPYLDCLRISSIRYRVLVLKNLKSSGTFGTCSSLRIILYDALALIRNQSYILPEMLSPCPILRDPDPELSLPSRKSPSSVKYRKYSVFTM